jgi:hypothetical protein
MGRRPLALKVGATLFTLGTAVLSAAFVTTHLKNPAAPLQPVVLESSTGSLTVGPSVRSGDVAPVTSTYAS